MRAMNHPLTLLALSTLSLLGAAIVWLPSAAVAIAPVTLPDLTIIVVVLDELGAWRHAERELSGVADAEHEVLKDLVGLEVLHDDPVGAGVAASDVAAMRKEESVVGEPVGGFAGVLSALALTPEHVMLKLARDEVDGALLSGVADSE